MTTQDTNLKIQALVAGQNTSAEARKASRDAAVNGGDSSFWDLLGSLSVGKSMTSTVLSTLDDAPTPVSAKETEDKEKSDKVRKKERENQKSAQAIDSPIAALKTETTQDQKDADDMWQMDAHQLTSLDMKALMNLNQAGPLPINQVNNLSRSLLENMPQGHYNSLTVSKGLRDMLENAYKTQRPVRIDLNESASIILRLSKTGQVSAEFLPTDQAADLFFRQNLSELKQRLESKQLPYGELIVRDWKQQQQNQQQKGKGKQ